MKTVVITGSENRKMCQKRCNEHIFTYKCECLTKQMNLYVGNKFLENKQEILPQRLLSWFNSFYYIVQLTLWQHDIVFMSMHRIVMMTMCRKIKHDKNKAQKYTFECNCLKLNRLNDYTFAHFQCCSLEIFDFKWIERQRKWNYTQLLSSTQ